MGRRALWRPHDLPDSISRSGPVLKHGSLVGTDLKQSDFTTKIAFTATGGQLSSPAEIPNSGEAIIAALVSPDSGWGAVTGANPRAVDVLGYDRDELLTMTPTDLTDGPDRDQLGRAATDLFAAGRERIALNLKAKDGSRVMVDMSLHLITLSDQAMGLCVFTNGRSGSVAGPDDDEVEADRRLLEESIKGAAVIQQSLLPEAPPSLAEAEIGWQFSPSYLVGGDIFNFFRLDETHLGFYICDVAGHGVPAAMITVSVSQMLQPVLGQILKKRLTEPPYYQIVRPEKVLIALDETFPFSRFNKFFSILYLILDLKTGRMVYGNAGHPPPVLIHADKTTDLLRERGPVIGLGGLLPFPQGETRLQPGDRLILYTDGAIDHRDTLGTILGLDQLKKMAAESVESTISGTLDHLFDRLVQYGQGRPFRDDVTLVGLHYLGQREK